MGKREKQLKNMKLDGKSLREILSTGKDIVVGSGYGDRYIRLRIMSHYWEQNKETIEELLSIMGEDLSFDEKYDKLKNTYDMSLQSPGAKLRIYLSKEVKEDDGTKL